MKADGWDSGAWAGGRGLLLFFSRADSRLFPACGALFHIPSTDQEPLVVTRLHRVGGCVGTSTGVGRARPGGEPAMFQGGARQWLSLSPPTATECWVNNREAENP